MNELSFIVYKVYNRGVILFTELSHQNVAVGDNSSDQSKISKASLKFYFLILFNLILCYIYILWIYNVVLSNFWLNLQPVLIQCNDIFKHRLFLVTKYAHPINLNHSSFINERITSILLDVLLLKIPL